MSITRARETDRWLCQGISGLPARQLHCHFGSLRLTQTWLSDCPAGNLPAWAGWLYWTNPLSYALRALVLNEFEAPRWHKPSPYDPARSLGTFILDTFDFNHGHW